MAARVLRLISLTFGPHSSEGKQRSGGGKDVIQSPTASRCWMDKNKHLCFVKATPQVWDVPAACWKMETTKVVPDL